MYFITKATKTENAVKLWGFPRISKPY